MEGEKMEAMTYFIFLGSKITADADCSHDSKRHMLLGRKAMTNLDSLLKSRDGTWPTTALCQQRSLKNTDTHTHMFFPVDRHTHTDTHTHGFSSSHI